MRILFVSLIPSYWGGSEVLWSQAATALAGQGHETAVFFAMYREAPQIDALKTAGVRLIHGTPPPMRWWRRLVHRTRPTRRIYSETLRRFRPDLVVFSQCAVRDGIAEILECADRGLPYAIINQLVEPLAYGAEFRDDIARAYRGARQVWFVSSENLETTSRFLGETLPNVEAIPNAYGCDYNCELPWPKSDTPLRLALVARLEPQQKGHDLVLEALADPVWRERKVTVSFFGAGPARESLPAQCRQLGLQDQVAFAGTAKPDAIWAGHHILLLPSRYEGQSLSMLEAMLHGRPVIATPVGGTRGLVIDGQTGFLATDAGLPAWRDVLERAWSERTKWPQLGAAAAVRVRAHVARDPGADLASRLLTLGALSPA